MFMMKAMSVSDCDAHDTRCVSVCSVFEIVYVNCVLCLMM